MSVSRLLGILCFCALEENILATHDELSQLQIKLEMKASPRDKDSISLAEQVRSVELKRGDVASFNFTQPIERNIASSTGTAASSRQTHLQQTLSSESVKSSIHSESKFRLIDVHFHTCPPFWVDWIAANFGVDACYAGSDNLTQMLDYMDSSEIAVAILSIPYPGISPASEDINRTRAVELSGTITNANDGLNMTGLEMTSKINKYLTSDLFRGASTSLRFGAFAAMPMPDVNATIAEIKRALDPPGYNGCTMDGVSLYTSYNGVHLSDPLFDPVWKELNARHAVVFIHPVAPDVANAPELPATAVEFPAETTRTYMSLWQRGVLDRYLNVSFIAVHGGGFIPYLASNWIESPKMKGTSSETEVTAKALRSIYMDTAKVTAEPNQGAMSALSAFANASNILVGGDYPFLKERAYIHELERFAEQSWTREQQRGVYHNNALKLFPRFRNLGTFSTAH
mmetsp:Transcript_18382/g.32911  ORF Transcript_18382/g.32911 Transcript_18382/m.32911 type:complete len:457 (+) Transcript_18382:73-1443(+)